MKKTKFKKFIINILYPLGALILGVIIFLGLDSILEIIHGTINAQYLWDFIGFGFIAGALILNIKMNELKLKSKVYIGRIGLLIIYSDILILLGYGIGLIHKSGNVSNIIYKIINLIPLMAGGIILFAGVFLFCGCLAIFMIELTIILFSKNN